MNIVLAGMIHHGRELFVSMVSRGGCQHTVVSYNRLMNGYCKNWKVDEATHLYREMIGKGIRPTVITYYTLLGGLFQEGKVGDARKLLGEMQLHDLALNLRTYNVYNQGFAKMIVFQRQWTYFIV